ncbi:MAG: hypothetical protein U9O18_03295 [Chloroflexota bacterium]|nr:hypothetical protein [Chloroflexota bacterium]
MMRRSIPAVFAVLLLTVSVGGAAMAQSAPAGTDQDLVRVEVPEAGIALSFPGDLETEVLMEREESELPPELAGSEPAYVWTTVVGLDEDGYGCIVSMYEAHPLSLEEHIDWIARGFVDEPEFDGTVESVPAVLPAGDATRIDIDATTTGFFGTGYLFELEGVRYQLKCVAETRTPDDWLAVAETIESIPLVPLELDPGPLASTPGVDLVMDFSTEVSVVDPSTPGFPEGALMNADCDFALWIEADDGSATEWLACTLSDEPIEPPEYQGTPPSAAFSVTGGECSWESDYWRISSRSQVAASGFELTVTPSGQVFGRSSYPAEPLDCFG